MKTLRHLELSGYKSIKNVKLDFYAGINVLIGQNGSGKSNLLNFIKLLEEDVLSLESDYKIKVEWFDDDEYKKELEQINSLPNASIFDSLNLDITKLKSKKTIQGKISKNKSTIFENSVIGVDKYKASLVKEIEINKDLELVEPRFKLIDFYNKEQLPFFSSPEDAELSFDGGLKVYNLNIPFGVVLFTTFFMTGRETKVTKEYVHTNFSLHAAALLEYVQVYSPIQDVRLKDIFTISQSEKEVSKSIENVQLEFLVNDSWYKWEQLSDGTRRILTIIDGVYFEQDIVLLEEPELGIHPHQLSLLIEFLTEMSEEKQIIISTHSPDVLDSVNMDSLNRINIVSINEKGTSVHKLTDEQKEKAKIYFEETGTIGDYWKHSDLEI